VTHEWSVSRQAPDGDAILGTLDTHGGATCYTLERTVFAIPEGRYQVTLTVSQRATRGELWAPGSDFKLPLLNSVPGRDGIRMHAGNVATDSIGCILLGSEIHGVSLEHSRPSVIRIVNLLQEADTAGDLVFLTVQSLKQPNWTKT
jgi:hypothetical protein